MVQCAGIVCMIVWLWFPFLSYGITTLYYPVYPVKHIELASVWGNVLYITAFIITFRLGFCRTVIKISVTSIHIMYIFKALSRQHPSNTNVGQETIGYINHNEGITLGDITSAKCGERRGWRNNELKLYVCILHVCICVRVRFKAEKQPRFYVVTLGD